MGKLFTGLYGIFNASASVIGTNKQTIMDKRMLLNADYLDIIYDGRNKTYGGYELRRSYGNRLRNAGGIMVLAVLGLVALVGFKRPVDSSSALHIVDRVVDLKDVILPPAVVPPPPPKAVQPPATQIKTSVFTKPVITDDVIPEDKTMSHVSDLHTTAVGVGNEGDSAAIGVVTEGKIGGRERVVTEVKPDKPHIFVEQMPTFNGDLMAYLAAHVKYPEAAREAGVEGRVVVEFVVNEQGNISNARVVKGIGGGCDEEALRVIAAMPAWKPGKQNGAAVKVLFNVAVKFVLQ